MRTLPVVVALAVLSAALAGCVGGEKRSEWAFDMTQLDVTYAQGVTGAGVVVAVLDTGVDVSHPSLDHLVDGDNGNGELIAFRDFLDGGEGVSRARDPDGHGSHVVGIIAARGSSFGHKLVNGGVDLLGAAPNVRLVVARVCDVKADTCDGDALVDALRWAVDVQGAQVVSMSLGGLVGEGLLDDVFGGEAQRQANDLEAAINDAVSEGVVVLAAAGNDGPDTEDVAFPARIPAVIAVGAMNDDGHVASFSNRGDADRDRCASSPLLEPTSRCAPDQKPELVAPGTLILSAWADDKYVRASGTSQATPFATAVVALMLEGKPRLHSASDVQQVKRVLMDTALELEDQVQPHDRAAGYGLVQAQSAVAAYHG